MSLRVCATSAASSSRRGCSPSASPPSRWPAWSSWPTTLTRRPPTRPPPAVSKPSSTPTARRRPTTPKAKPKAKPIKRGEVLVEVFNNTRVKGLAGGVADKAKAAGWNVVGSDNWYGTIDGTSVYYPPRLKEAARALGRDLGIKQLRAAEEPMRFDRVTVILTDDYR